MQVAHDLLDIPNVHLGALCDVPADFNIYNPFGSNRKEFREQHYTQVVLPPSTPIVSMSEQEVNNEDEGDENARS